MHLQQQLQFGYYLETSGAPGTAQDFSLSQQQNGNKVETRERLERRGRETNQTYAQRRRLVAR